MLKRIDAYKKKIDAYRPFGPELLPSIQAYYRVGLTYTSNALEGVSYSESETKVLLEDGLTVGGKHLRDALAVVGHAKAYDHMFSLLHKHKIDIQDLVDMHALLADGLERGEAGKYRDKQIFVTGTSYVFPAPADVPERMQAFQEWMDDERGKLHPVVFAAQVHNNFLNIHPFGDGNGRIGRLAMNTALIQEGYLPVIIPPILRPEYMDAIKEAQMFKNDAVFQAFVELCEIEVQKEMLPMLRGTDKQAENNSMPDDDVADDADISPGYAKPSPLLNTC